MDQCPECGHERQTIQGEQYACLNGFSFLVQEAEWYYCTNCNLKTATAKEVRRWEEIGKQQLKQLHAIPTKEDVKRLRKEMGLTAQNFARIFGVTRQTVHAWERNGVELSPAALLIKLLLEDESGYCRTQLIEWSNRR
jgi:putative zinc finger/helix-turn-helix YgiT family protein